MIINPLVFILISIKTIFIWGCFILDNKDNNVRVEQTEYEARQELLGRLDANKERKNPKESFINNKDTYKKPYIKIIQVIIYVSLFFILFLNINRLTKSAIIPIPDTVEVLYNSTLKKDAKSLQQEMKLRNNSEQVGLFEYNLNYDDFSKVYLNYESKSEMNPVDLALTELLEKDIKDLSKQLSETYHRPVTLHMISRENSIHFLSATNGKLTKKYYEKENKSIIDNKIINKYMKDGSQK